MLCDCLKVFLFLGYAETMLGIMFSFFVQEWQLELNSPGSKYVCK